MSEENGLKNVIVELITHFGYKATPDNIDVIYRELEANTMDTSIVALVGRNLSKLK